MAAIDVSWDSEHAQVNIPDLWDNNVECEDLLPDVAQAQYRPARGRGPRRRSGAAVVVSAPSGRPPASKSASNSGRVGVLIQALRGLA